MPRKSVSPSPDKWPDLEQAWLNRQVNQPRETQGVSVRPTNAIENFWLNNVGGGVSAVNYPWGTIAINRKVVEEDKNLEDTLTHEITHRNQGLRPKMRFLDLFRSWENRELEKEAITSESKYKKKPLGRDIYLPPEKSRK